MCDAGGVGVRALDRAESADGNCVEGGGVMLLRVLFSTSGVLGPESAAGVS